jgi:DNA modification methylase
MYRTIEIFEKKQIPIFLEQHIEERKKNGESEWGTFKDSLRAPIHSWFTYPAGFSYKAVESSFKKNGILKGQTVYDPFMGTGTTNLVAKKYAINSYGVEAHPFVFRIAKAKLNWNVNRADALAAVDIIERKVISLQKRKKKNLEDFLADQFPELIIKCYETNTLYDLFLIRNEITSGEFSKPVNDLLLVALTRLLREVSTAATGWPYVAPQKFNSSAIGKNALKEYYRLFIKMLGDIETTIKTASKDYDLSAHNIFNSDSRDTTKYIPSRCIDHVFTSPPYLNNYDYADRTRLELYFFGDAKTWGDITELVRTKLITSATTQIKRDDPRYHLSLELKQDVPEVYDYLGTAISRLSDLRVTKGGKKSYDRLVSGYFNDMYRILKDTFRVMKPRSSAIFVLGDSAPYGVHIPTDEFIGKIGKGIGFKDYSTDILRTRGGKWKNNPQRHDVALRESIVTLIK